MSPTAAWSVKAMCKINNDSFDFCHGCLLCGSFSEETVHVCVCAGIRVDAKLKKINANSISLCLLNTKTKECKQKAHFSSNWFVNKCVMCSMHDRIEFIFQPNNLNLHTRYQTKRNFIGIWQRTFAFFSFINQSPLDAPFALNLCSLRYKYTFNLITYHFYNNNKN